MSGYLLLDGAAASRADTADKAQLDLTGNMELIACVEPDDWNAVTTFPILTKYIGTQRSYRFWLGTPGSTTLKRPHFTWSPDGTTGSAVTIVPGTAPANPSAPRWFRWVFIQNNGSNSQLFTYYSDDPPTTDHLSVSWTAISSGTATTTAVFSGSSAVQVGVENNGTNFWPGKVYGCWLYNGTSAGTLVANPDFRTNTQDDWENPPSDDTVGNTWAFVGNAVWVPPVGGDDPANLLASVLDEDVTLTWDV